MISNYARDLISGKIHYLCYKHILSSFDILDQRISFIFGFIHSNHSKPNIFGNQY
jgi:hypothetical protein